VTIDYAKLARGIQAQGERKRNAPPSIEVEPLEQNFEATFRVGRGTFRLLHELQEIDPALWARQFASGKASSTSSPGASSSQSSPRHKATPPT
jgi:hypothetical protein